MKKIARLLGILAALWGAALPALAQEAVASGQMRSLAEPGHDPGPTLLNAFHLGGSYVFPSEVKNGRGYGEQDALQSAIQYSHRFRLTGSIYVRAGVAYDRFDFGRTSAPLPEQLHSFAGILALEYMVGNDVGAFLEMRPGYYAEENFDSSSFDVPITLGRVFILQQDRLFLFVGVSTAFLRPEYTVLPLVGLVWKPNEQWNIFAVPPEPRITYAPSKHLVFWAGGQLVGGSFRTDHDPNIMPRRLSGAAVNYTEYRAGAGVEFRPNEAVSFNLGGGYTFQRRFNFKRADEEYETEGAPYLRAAFKAEF
ncbi:hypothetical protein BH20VER1_BH20VER1_23450 [soil metagenome]